MPGPLEGVVIVDLSRVVAGPQATMALADLGARVIKVEQPGTGDETRGWGPPFAGPDQVSTYYLSINRNKESITLDLKSDEGKDTLARLVRHADVLVRTGARSREARVPARRRVDLDRRPAALKPRPGFETMPTPPFGATL